MRRLAVHLQVQVFALGSGPRVADGDGDEDLKLDRARGRRREGAVTRGARVGRIDGIKPMRCVPSGAEVLALQAAAPARLHLATELRGVVLATGGRKALHVRVDVLPACQPVDDLCAVGVALIVGLHELLAGAAVRQNELRLVPPPASGVVKMQLVGAWREAHLLDI